MDHMLKIWQTITGTSSDAATPAGRRRWMWVYVIVLVACFLPLYLTTRANVLISDGPSRVEAVMSRDLSDIQYMYPTYPLGVALIHAVWAVLLKLGISVSVESVLLGLNSIGTISAIIFLGLIAAEILETRRAAWLAAFLFGVSLNPWTQWNGELSGWSAGFGTTALFFVLRGRLLAPVILWALAVLSHVDFVFLTPALACAVWIGRWSTESTLWKLRRIGALIILSASTTIGLLLIGTRVAGKWTNFQELKTWFLLPMQFSGHLGFTTGFGPSIFRALKGLATAFTAAGHHWRNILTGRGAFDNPIFGPAAGLGLLILAVMAIFILFAVWQKRLALFALALLLTFQMLENWWLVPTQEEYDTGALLGLILLITAGMFQMGKRLPRRSRPWLAAVYVAACGGLNLFTAVLPMQANEKQIEALSGSLSRLNIARGGMIAFVTCDKGPAIEQSGVEYLRIRDYWTGRIPDMQHTVLSWIDARLKEGKDVYVQDTLCFPDEWIVPPQPPFDLHFVDRDYRSIETSLKRAPLPRSSPTDPMAWRHDDIVQIVPRR